VTKALYIPGADRTSQWFGGNWAGLIVPDLDKILLHSTETSGWPGYNGNGSNAPTMTINPWTRKIRQHFILPESARALMNPSSTPVPENKDEVCQIEIIGYSDSAVAKKVGRTDRDLDNLTDSDLRWIASLLVFIMREWTVPNVWATPFPWPCYPASYGNTSSRMSSSEYDKFAGILGHLHASGNTHGDPKINVVKLKQFVTELLSPAPKPPAPAPVTTTQEPKMVLVRVRNTAPVYVSNGLERRWIENSTDLCGLQRAIKNEGGKGTVTTIEPAELEGFGPLVGKAPSA